MCFGCFRAGQREGDVGKGHDDVAVDTNEWGIGEDAEMTGLGGRGSGTSSEVSLTGVGN